MKPFILRIIVSLLFLTLIRSAVPAQSPVGVPSTSGNQPLGKYLGPDGTLSVPTGFNGNFDVSGYRMVTDADGRPRFLPSPAKASSVPADSAWDDRFTYPGISGSVYALVKSGSDIFVAGLLQQANGQPVGNIARWDGSHWYPLGSGVNGLVYALAVRGTDLYVGGTFTMAGGDSAKYIARWDGSDWSPLGSGMNGQVLALLVDSVRLYAAGYFTTAGDNPVQYLAAWNDTAWSAPGASPNSPVNALALGGGYLYAGGSFDSIGGVPARRIARWDGNVWSTLGSGALGTGGVFCLSTFGDELFAAGLFDTIGGTPAQNIARWDGISWSALGAGISQSVGAILACDSGVYAGGYFQTAGGMPVRSVAHWNGTSWGSLAGGVDNAIVEVFLEDGADIIVGGNFTVAGGTPMRYISRWDGADWSPIHDASGGSGFSSTLFDLAVNKTTTYASGGPPMDAGTVPAWSLARWSGNGWSDCGLDTASSVGSVAVIGNTLYAAGVFTSIAGVAANNIAQWDGVTWSALGSGVNGTVATLEASGSTLYVGGSFTTAGGGAANYIAFWTGSTWYPLGGGPGLPVQSIATIGSIVAALRLNSISIWNGVSWSSIGGVSGFFGGVISAIASDGSTLYVGGEFGSVGFASADNIASWKSGPGWSEVGGGVNGPVSSLAMSGTDLYIGGDFDTVGNIPANRIARWDGSGWSALGSGIDSTVRELAISGGDLYAAGPFSTAGGKPSTRFAHWTIDAPSPPDWAWAKGVDDLVTSSYPTATTTDSAGNVYVAGYYSGGSIDFGSGPTPYVAGEDIFLVKFTQSGTPVWVMTAGSPVNERATGVAVAPDGSVLLSGWYGHSSLTLDTITLPPPASGMDVFVAKFNATGDVLWARAAGGTLDDIPGAIDVDDDGRAYITGQFSSPSLQFGGTTALTNSSSPTSDMFLAVYDPSGTALWSRREGGSGDESGSGIVVDPGGNIYCTGGFTSGLITFGSNPLLFNGGGEDFFVVQYDTAGTPIWSRSSLGASDDAGTNIAIDPFGDVVVSGLFSGPSLTFGATVLTNSLYGPGRFDAFLVKYTSSGTVRWAHRAGGTRAEDATGLVTDTDGNVYLGGHFPSEKFDAGRFTYYNTAAPASDLFIAKFDSGGRSQWVVVPGGSDNDLSAALAIDPAGNLILAGTFSSPTLGFGTHTLTNGGPASDNMFVAKMGGTDIQIPTEREVALASGWNLVSLPVLPADTSVATIFPAALSNAYAYTTSGYATAATMDPGIGYWLKYPAATPVVIPGFSFSSQSVPVSEGWNIVGSVSYPFAAASLTSTPPGMVTGSFFGYVGGYTTSDTIQPGKGYWVKVSADGELHLSTLTATAGSTPVLPQVSRIVIRPTSELPPPPPADESDPQPTSETPERFALGQNHPNPFNPSTVIRYELPVMARVTLNVYNLLGEEVATLVDGIQEAGYRSVVWDAAALSSGVYYYRLQAGEFVQTRTMLLVK